MLTDYGDFVVRPLTPRLGAEVVGVEMADVDESLAQSVHQAWMDWKVLFFRDQILEPAQHIRFAALFGEPEIHPYVPKDGNAEVVVLDSAGEGPARANFWHTDVSFREKPPLGSVLRGRIIPDVGGDTSWIDMEQVYEDLTDDLKDKLDGATATHTMRNTFGAHLSPAELELELEKYPDQHHPVVRTHPVTDRKCLYLNAPFVSHLDGMDSAESKALLKRLYGAIYSKLEHQVRFRWQPNSFAMWDNRCTQHYAIYDYTERRRVERVTLMGDRPR